jgi:hypothetical protein
VNEIFVRTAPIADEPDMIDHTAVGCSRCDRSMSPVVADCDHQQLLNDSSDQT